MQEKEPTQSESSTKPQAKPQAFHAIVHGAVQGVGFRYFTRANAARSGVAGWVRNLPDGTVEVWAEGTKPRLQQFISAINRGPTHGYVSAVNLSWETATGDWRGFHIRD